jgi:SOS response regulatory protein OraA/RecX
MTDADAPRDPLDGDREKAMRFVVNSLAARAQSVVEIERKLAARGVRGEVAEAVIAEARALRYLDDTELAGQLARGFRARGYGRRRAALALRRRGLAAEDADSALDEAFGDADEVTLARAALGSRVIDDPASERRAVAFLVRRGFSAGAAWQAVHRRTDLDR